MNARDHYDKHLGNFYSWMLGAFVEKQLEQEQFFRSHDIFPHSSSSIALDLGCGHGLQSVSLAKLGFSVTSVDFNVQLLNELREKKSNLAITVIENDLLSFLEHYKTKVELIVCMGDTLTHLESKLQVEKLIKNSEKLLTSNGKIVLSFRDLTLELKDEQRFIPVRSDEHRILTCFLEYFSDHILVHDILHENENGTWKQKISSYPKLKLTEKYIKDILIQYDLKFVQSKIINRMIYLIAEKN